MASGIRYNTTMVRPTMVPLPGPQTSDASGLFISVNHDITRKQHPQAVRPLLPEIEAFAKFNHFQVLHPLLRLVTRVTYVVRVLRSLCEGSSPWD